MPEHAVDPAHRPLSTMDWLSGGSNPDLLRDLLREVIDPELGVNIVDLGLVYGARVVDSVAEIRMTMTTPGCPLGDYLEDSVRESLWGAPGVEDVRVQIVWDPPWNPEMMSGDARRVLGWG